MKALVICLRGCHLGYLGCYGCAWVSTPAVNRLAASGVVFDQHFADVPEPSAARRTWRDGRHHFPVADTPANQPTFDLLASLRAAGIRSLLVADGGRALPDEWMQGWDEAEVVQGEEGQRLEQALEVARAGLETLAAEGQGLLWVDLATLLPPWRVPADFSDPYFQDSPEVGEEAEAEAEEEEEEDDEFDTEEEPPEEEAEEDPLTPWPDPPVGPIDTEDDIDFCRLQSTFAGAVSYLDAGVGVLLEELDRLGLTRDCAVILTADHGQALGEHGFCGPYRPWLHDELIHLPLVMRLPGRPAEGARVAALTQSVDLAPTLLDLFGLAVPPELHGRSLLPLAREEPSATKREHVCCALRIGEAAEACLRTPESAFLLPLRTADDDPPRGPQLFVKPDDRWEVNDVIQHHLDEAEAMEKTLRAYLADQGLSASS